MLSYPNGNFTKENKIFDMIIHENPQGLKIGGQKFGEV
jgi:hypothetical protein